MLFFSAVTLASEVVSVGVLAPRGVARAQAEWAPTMAHLGRAVPSHRFQIHPLEWDALEAAVISGSVDFVITNPGQFVFLAVPYELSWLATLRSPQTGSSREALGSVLLVRADSPFQDLIDLRGHPVGAAHPRGFGGYLLLQPQLRKHGIVAASAFQLRFLGFPIDQLLYELRDGSLDAAVVPACLLERMSAEGLLDSSRFRSLLPNIGLGDCLSNTPAFPSWSFAAQPHVSEQLSRQVAQALLEQRKEGESVWGAAMSSAQIELLYSSLQLHPLQVPFREQLGQWLLRYWPYWMLALLLMFLGLLRHLWLQRQALRHSRKLADTQVRLRERDRELAAAQRWSQLGELAAGLAHELNQPLAAIRHYAEGCSLRLEQQDVEHPLLPVLERIDQEAARGAAVVQQTRQWLRSQPPQLEALELGELLQELVDIQSPQLKPAGVRLVLELVSRPLWVQGNRLALEQVLINLVNNSLQAYQACSSRGVIGIHVDVESPWVVIRVVDAAGGYSDERLREPFVPFRSTHHGGLGMGLLICQRLMQAQGGQLHLANAGPGAEASLRLREGQQ